MKKKLGVLLLLIMLFIGGSQVSAAVGDVFDIGGLSYEVLTESGETGTVTVTGLASSATEINIPATVTNGGVNYTVTEVAGNAFAYKELTKVTFPNTIEVIGQHAFNYNYLTELVLPDSLVTLGEGAFSKNKITDLTLSKGLSIINGNAFSSNLIVNLTIPDNVTEIKRDAFNSNEIENLVLGEKVKIIGSNAFQDNKISSVDLTGIEIIGGYAFHSNNIESIKIPESVKSISLRFLMFNRLSTVYLENEDSLSRFSNTEILRYASSDSLASAGIIEIYAPKLVPEYKDSSDIVKYTGEAFDIEVNPKTVYRQVEKYDDSNAAYLGADETAPTQESDITLPAVYQWYKDGVAIDGATNKVYSEKAAEAGEYEYYVKVNDEALGKIKVSIKEKKVAKPPVEPPVEPPVDIEPTKTGDSNIPPFAIMGIMIAALGFAGFGIFKLRKN